MQGCDRSADSAAGMARGGVQPLRKPGSHSGAKAINPKGMGTESTSEEAVFLYEVVAALVRQLRGRT
jgi:hypothetical protein